MTGSPSAADPRDTVRRIAQFNAGREPERLAFKFRAMRESAFAFLRGTAHLFWEDWHGEYAAFDRPPYVWATGDLHLENVGSFRGDNRLVYFDLNDFDEGALGPALWDLARFITSIHVAAAGLELPKRTAGALAKTFLDAYVDALRDGKARWVERAIAKGMVKELLESVKGRTREALLDARTTLAGKRRRLRIDDVRALPASKHERRAVSECLDQFGRGTGDAPFYDVLDVARRIAGTASLGQPRYVVLIRGDGSPDGNWLLDLKSARPSALAPYVRHHGQPAWPNEAERIVQVQHRMQAICPALLQSVALDGRPFVLRELQPTEDRLKLAHWHGRLRRLERVMQTIGHLVAWAQLRSSSRNGAAGIDELIAFADETAWRRELLDAGREYSRRVEAQWRAFTKAGDSDLVSE